MAILGNIIKGVINLKDSLSSETDHVEAQKQVLKTLLSTAKETKFGRYYDFESILNSDDIQKSFVSNIPYFDYHSLSKDWWHKIQDGETDVTWPGKPSYFALSSGTTGKTSKRIPVTDDMLSAIKDAGVKQVFSLSHFDLEPDFFEKEIMMLGSSTDLKQNNDFLEGEISGITASNIPFWFKGYYKPGEDIAKIDNWDERIQHIAENAKKWDIGALSGIPSWIELMLEKVIAYHNLENIHDIWPNLSVYTSGGVAFSPYAKSFKALLGKPVTVIDTYLASEGYLATQIRPETDAMQLNTNNGVYFEFIPFKAEYIKEDGSIVQTTPSLTLEEVEAETDYILIISTVSGAWRYLIGDTIKFTDIEKAEIKITGRTKFFLNTVGSQLSVNKMDDAMKFLEDTFATQITEYTVCAKRLDDGEFYHCWYIGSNKEISEKETANTLDEFLKEANKNYKVARSKALEGVKVEIIPPQTFYDWNERNKKKGGQVKMERVMNEEKFAEWEKFVKNK